MRRRSHSAAGQTHLCSCHVSPQCQNYSQNAVVLENQPAGTLVLRVQAQDADMGVNGEVKYGIMHRDGVSSGFAIEPDTGEFHSQRLQVISWGQ